MKKKKLKKLKTNRATEKLLSQDLSPYIHSENFKPMQFELKPKNQTVTIRMSEELLKALKNKSRKQGIHYQKLIRQALEKSL